MKVDGGGGIQQCHPADTLETKKVRGFDLSNLWDLHDNIYQVHVDIDIDIQLINVDIQLIEIKINFYTFIFYFYALYVNSKENQNLDIFSV